MADDYPDQPLTLQDLGVPSEKKWGLPVIRVVNQDNGMQKHRNWLSKLNDWWIK